MSSCSQVKKYMLESATPSLKFLILRFLGPQTLYYLISECQFILMGLCTILAVKYVYITSPLVIKVKKT